MAYSMAQFRDRIGIGRETLRFYEQRGLLHPERKDGSSYRVYTDFDGLEVLRVKMMQSFQMSLEEIFTTNSEATLDEMENRLANVEAQLQAQLDRVQTELLRIRKHRSFVQEAMGNENGVCELDAYGGIYKLMLFGEDVMPDKTMGEIASEWIQHMPMCDIGWEIPMVKLMESEGQSVSTRVGLMMLPRFAEEYSLSVRPPVYMFPTGHCIRMMLKKEDPFHVRKEEFAPLFEYAEKKNYRIVSDITGRYSGYSCEAGKPYYHFSARVVVEKRT